jgi:ankyrin repeat protein
MRKLQLGTEFYIATIIAMICCILILGICHQEEHIDYACDAIENFDQEAMVLHVDQVLNVDGIGTRNETMLMVACKVGNADAIEYLISRGADPNYTVRGALTPLELFCRSGYEGGEEALLLLLNSGLKQSNYSERPAIFVLAENFYWMNKDQKKVATEEAIIMLKAGAPMGYADTSLLHLAAKSDMYDLFYTISHTTQGLSMMTMEDGDGNTPWEVAIKYGATNVQKMIREMEREWQEEEDKKKPTEPTNPTTPETTLPPNTDTEDYIENPQVPTEDFDLDEWLSGVGT